MGREYRKKKARLAGDGGVGGGGRWFFTINTPMKTLTV